MLEAFFGIALSCAIPIFIWYGSRFWLLIAEFRELEHRLAAAQFPTTEAWRDAFVILFVEELHQHDRGIPIRQIREVLMRAACEFYQCHVTFQQKYTKVVWPDVKFGMPFDDIAAARTWTKRVDASLDEISAGLKSHTQKILNIVVYTALAFPDAAFEDWETFRSDQEKLSVFRIPILDSCDPERFKSVMRIVHNYIHDIPVHVSALDFNLEKASAKILTRTQIQKGERLGLEELEALPSHFVEQFRNTPIYPIFFTTVPFSFPTQSRMAHAVLVAGSDRGKTQTLEALIYNDLQDVNPPGMVVIDSKGDMVRKLCRIQHPGKVIYVDPRDGPSLNLFDVKGGDEETTNRTITQLSYFFRSLLGAEISSTMGLAFHPLVQLMLKVPGANLNTFADAMDDLSPFESYIEELPSSTRHFLEREFFTLTGFETRNAVKRRIRGLAIQSPTFDRMFNARTNRLDIGQALDDGTMILVNTDKDFLGEFSALFGKYMISMTVAAALQRASIPEGLRKPAYLIVDEAQDYFDDKTEEILRTLRSYRLGSVMAFQDFGRTPASLLSAIFSSTSIKMIGSDSSQDARVMAPEMKTTPEFILAQNKVDFKVTEIATYIRGVTKSAISLPVPLGVLDNVPRKTDAQYAVFLEMNRAALVEPEEVPVRVETPKNLKPSSGSRPKPVAAAPKPAERTKDVPIGPSEDY